MIRIALTVLSEKVGCADLEGGALMGVFALQLRQLAPQSRTYTHTHPCLQSIHSQIHTRMSIRCSKEEICTIYQIM